MKTPATQTDETPAVPVQAKEAQATPPAAPVAWEEFLEDASDCCGGCNHKPR